MEPRHTKLTLRVLQTIRLWADSKHEVIGDFLKKKKQ
jgi:hypothetical protein